MTKNTKGAVSKGQLFLWETKINYPEIRKKCTAKTATTHYSL